MLDIMSNKSSLWSLLQYFAGSHFLKETFFRLGGKFLQLTWQCQWRQFPHYNSSPCKQKKLKMAPVSAHIKQSAWYPLHWFHRNIFFEVEATLKLPMCFHRSPTSQCWDQSPLQSAKYCQIHCLSWVFPHCTIILTAVNLNTTYLQCKFISLTID